MTGLLDLVTEMYHFPVTQNRPGTGNLTRSERTCFDQAHHDRKNIPLRLAYSRRCRMYGMHYCAGATEYSGIS